MATTVSHTSSYAGTASPFFKQAIIESKTINTPGIDTDFAVPYKKALRGIDLTDAIVSGGSCGWTATGSLSVTEGVLTVKEFHASIELCPEDFKSSWDFKSSTELPADVQESIMDLLAKRSRAKTDADVWKSTISTTGLSYTVTGQFDGILKQLNGTAIEITGVTLTKSNIADQIARVVSAQPAAYFGIPESEKVIFVSHKAESLYKQNLSAQGVNTTAGVYPSDFGGLEIRGVSLPDNAMVLMLRESLHVFGNVNLDAASIDLVNLYPTTLEKEVRVGLSYAYNVGITNKDQAVLYNY